MADGGGGLESANEALLGALHGSRLGVLVTDADATIRYANPALCESSGYDLDEIIGASPRLFGSGCQSRTFYERMWRTIAGGRVWSGSLVNRRKDGSLQTVILEIAPVVGAPPAGVVGYLGLFRVQTDDSPPPSSVFDALTGLPAEPAFEKVFDDQIDRARLLQRTVSLARIDVDRFKSLNDALGRFVCDQVLIEVARRIQRSIRHDDTLARFSGDEFALLLTDQASEADVLERILAAVRQPIEAGGHALDLTVSIGVARFPGDADTAAELMGCADAAVRTAKCDGRNTWRRFVPSQSAGRGLGRREVLSQLRHALSREELVLHYQPQLSLHSGEIIGVEALLRWAHPDGGLIAPSTFLPLAEENGLIIPISEWVLERACSQAAEWRAAGLTPLRIGVNVSARHFRYLDLPETVRAALRRSGLEARHLELELTESVLMHDMAAVGRVVDALKALGVRLSLDDFGTGYSSLAYLSRLAIDALKIDRSFVRDITTNAVNASIASATIAMAHKLGKTVVAEGVENEGQMHLLRRQGCDEMQGFLFAPALPAHELAARLARGDRLDIHGTRSRSVDASRLLLVDDEPNILSSLRRLLRREGYEIFTAQSGAEALELLARERVHVIVSDQRMPGMSGTEFLGKVKSMYPETVRIVLSGYADLASVTEAINQGAIYKYFSKPWDDDLLKNELRIAFRQQRARRRDSPDAGAAEETRW